MPALRRAKAIISRIEVFVFNDQDAFVHAGSAGGL
jgi:hypothetical protein